ncbi:LuxR C-terminal-related transcriptional regulator [Novosphingobium beihaiensis]|uniref:Helix-turn-helix transcriptional regulator n=1 Tax=Novosphingobium beihaiensis TaxID=2930389 RepID=A0ABT0BV32_9SPHN|nr:helix-turn-helix transcriptional regulator [Novosphingobium beihaiensis]MCJ2188935.1 helix-turn-helix transcriptional regulator [Novosphingobium beihaiensis]
MPEDIPTLDQLESLTPKQVEVLDLLIMHRTTKEIARELSIAPNTVDQRINAVRDKWGTANRKDTARRYSQLLEQCGKTTCGFSRVDPQEQGAEDSERDLPVDPVFVLSDASALRRHQDWYEDMESAPAGLEALDARFGRAGRIGAVLVLALVMALTLVSSLAIAEALGRLI